ncbi:hypothetical protein YC2023_080404 [Brassica napus]
MAARSDEQMSFLLSTIDQIDEVKFVDTLGIYRVFARLKASHYLFSQSVANLIAGPFIFFALVINSQALEDSVCSFGSHIFTS